MGITLYQSINFLLVPIFVTFYNALNPHICDYAEDYVKSELRLKCNK